MQEKTTHFLLSLLNDGEELGKFPKEFVEASIKWLCSWLIKGDPVVEAVLVSKGNHALKAKVLEMKLPALQQNEQFIRELGRRMTDYEGMKNVILKSKVDVKGDANIGDKGKVSEGEVKGTKNSIIGSEVTVGGSLTLGDQHQTTTTIITHSGSGDVVQGGKHQTTNNYYGAGGQNIPADKTDIKKVVELLIAKGELEEAIASVVDYSEKNAPRVYSDALQLSGRFHFVRGKVVKGVLSTSESTLEQNKIQAALIDLLSKL